MIVIDAFNKYIYKNKGFLTIEASVIVPMILLSVFVIIFGLIFSYERGYVLEKEYETLYSIPLNIIRDDTVGDFLAGKDFSVYVINGDLNVNGSYRMHKAVYEGSLNLMGIREIKSKREIDVCVDRLRRWQLYDDIAEKSGD